MGRIVLAEFDKVSLYWKEQNVNSSRNEKIDEQTTNKAASDHGEGHPYCHPQCRALWLQPLVIVGNKRN